MAKMITDKRLQPAPILSVSRPAILLLSRTYFIFDDAFLFQCWLVIGLGFIEVILVFALQILEFFGITFTEVLHYTIA